MAGVIKAGCVHLCSLTLCDPIWQVTLRIAVSWNTSINGYTVPFKWFSLKQKLRFQVQDLTYGFIRREFYCLFIFSLLLNTRTKQHKLITELCKPVFIHRRQLPRCFRQTDCVHHACSDRYNSQQHDSLYDTVTDIIETQTYKVNINLPVIVLLYTVQYSVSNAQYNQPIQYTRTIRQSCWSWGAMMELLRADRNLLWI